MLFKNILILFWYFLKTCFCGTSKLLLGFLFYLMQWSSINIDICWMKITSSNPGEHYVSNTKTLIQEVIYRLQYYAGKSKEF